MQNRAGRLETASTIFGKRSAKLKPSPHATAVVTRHDANRSAVSQRAIPSSSTSLVYWSREAKASAFKLGGGARQDERSEVTFTAVVHSYTPPGLRSSRLSQY